MSRYNYYGWSPYVPVAQRRANAAKKMEKLRKQGQDIQPVTIEGRLIARSFWGRAWCDHLDSFGDYANRLPRGRTYVRNGSVCHLGIGKGKVDAYVSGSSLYTVTMTIDTLPAVKWQKLKQRCKGGIGSLLELLQGKLSDEIMSVVTDRGDGLFPGPREIRYKCSCPDSASMCKHIAAVVYGIGARLDERPDLLFVLRGVDHEELIDADAAATAVQAAGASGKSRRRRLAANNLEGVFGVEFDTADEAPEPAPPKRAKKAAKKAAGKVAKNTISNESRPFRVTPASIRKLRAGLGLTRPEFAKRLGVSAQSVVNWETKSGPLNLQAAKLASVRALAREAGF